MESVGIIAFVDIKLCLNLQSCC